MSNPSVVSNDYLLIRRNTTIWLFDDVLGSHQELSTTGVYGNGGPA